jgi:nucleotide-binding universal stress UspA family protein
MLKQALLPLNPFPDTMLSSELDVLVDAVSLLDARADVLINSARIPPVSSALGGLVLDVPGLISETEERCARHAAEMEQQFQSIATSKSVVLSVARTGVFPGEFPAVATLAARYRDLSLVLLRQNDPASRQLAEALVFGAGRPVLILRNDVPLQHVGSFAIAWDGSRVAARALADALSLFPTATVHILTVSDEKRLPQANAGEHLLGIMERAGRIARLAQLKAEGRPIASELQRAARSHDAGLLVMGGFGHSRLRDFVLGGATAGILSDLKVPVLLAH